MPQPAAIAFARVPVQIECRSDGVRSVFGMSSMFLSKVRLQGGSDLISSQQRFL
jgi:hypothetical protein